MIGRSDRWHESPLALHTSQPRTKHHADDPSGRIGLSSIACAAAVDSSMRPSAAIPCSMPGSWASVPTVELKAIGSDWATGGPYVGHGWATKQNAHCEVGVCCRPKPRICWLRGLDLNQRPLGYEPNELPDCSTPRLKNESVARKGPSLQLLATVFPRIKAPLPSTIAGSALHPGSR